MKTEDDFKEAVKAKDTFLASAFLLAMRIRMRIYIRWRPG